MRHPVATALVSAGALIAIAIPALEIRSVLSDARIFPHGSEVRRVDEALGDASRFDPGGASAMQVVVTTHGSPLEPDNLRALRAYAARIAATEGVRGVRSPFDELDPDALSAGGARAQGRARSGRDDARAHGARGRVAARGDGPAPLALDAGGRRCWRPCAASRTGAST